MLILSEGVPLFIRLLCSAFAALGGVALVKTALDGMAQSRTSWAGIIVLCLLELLFLSTWFLRLEISYDEKAKTLNVNRTGWKTHISASSITQVTCSPVGGFLGSDRWAVKLWIGSEEYEVVRCASEDAARQLADDVRNVIRVQP